MTDPSVSPGITRPSVWRGLSSLLSADAIVQLRNSRSLVLSFAPPLVLLFAVSAGKRAAIFGEPSARVALSLLLGIATISILGYTMSIARDRETGVFQRLRVTPIPPAAIMISRLLVQAVAVLAMTVVVLIAATIFVHLSMSALAYALTLLVVAFGSAVFLSIAQAMVGLIRSADTINAVGRFVLIALFALGLLSDLKVFGTTFETITKWSPGGAVAAMLSAAMNPATWTGDTWWAMAVSLGYCVVFAGVGIRWFRWTSR